MRTGPRIVPAGAEQADEGVGFINDPRRFPYFRLKNKNRSRPKRAKLRDQSLLQQVGSEWSLLSESEKADWDSAGGFNNLSGYQLFTQDISYRIKHGLSYPVTPSDFYQTFIGHVQMPNASGGWILSQDHPRRYFILQPVEGRRGLVKKIKVVEEVGGDIEIKFNYKSDVFAIGANDALELQVLVNFPYHGYYNWQMLTLPLSYSTDWTSVSFIVEPYVIPINYYSFRLEFYSLKGDFWFDNLEVNHDGKNWSYSPYFNNIDGEYQELPNGYIWPYWVYSDRPEYFSFDNVFYD